MSDFGVTRSRSFALGSNEFKTTTENNTVKIEGRGLSFSISLDKSSESRPRSTIGGTLSKQFQVEKPIIQESSDKETIEGRQSKTKQPFTQTDALSFRRAYSTMINLVADKAYASGNSNERTANIQKSLNEISSAFDDVLELLGETPATQDQMKELSSKFDDAVHVIENAMHNAAEFTDSKSVKEFLQASVEGLMLLKNAVNDRKEYLQLAVDNAPLSEHSVQFSKTFSTEGAIDLAKEIIAKNQDKPKVVEKFTQIIKGLEQHKEDLLSDAPKDEPLKKSDVKKIIGSDGPDHGIGMNSPTKILERSSKKELETSIKESVKNGEFPVLPTKSEVMREDGMLEILFKAALKETGLKEPKDVRSSLLEHRLGALNKQPWKPIEKEVQLTFNGVPTTVVSKLTPQSQLGGGKVFTDLKDGGVVCHMSRKFEHVATLAHTQITNGEGKVLFDGTRHGALATYDISSSKLPKLGKSEIEDMVKTLLPTELWKTKDGEADLDSTVKALKEGGKKEKSYREECCSKMRENGAYSRAKDVTTSVLVKNSEKFERALKGEEVHININSIGLLTPSPIRSVLAKNGSKASNEEKMLKEQIGAWEKLSKEKQPVTLEVRDPNTNEMTKVKVHIDVNTFNFGVNGLSLQGVKSKINFLGAWDEVKQTNDKGMAKLLGTPEQREKGEFGGRVGEFLKNPGNTSPERIEHIKELARQINDIYASESFKSPKFEPYQMVSRLAVLTHFMGDDPCWNCKSGKDRTGETHVEASLLATEIEMTGKVPPPDQERSKSGKSNLFRMATEGGNLEIQRYNTGAAGFKLSGVDTLAEQYNIDGGKKNVHMTQVKGIAGNYGS